MKVLPPRTILVVDDDDDVRSALARLLGLAGYTVLTAESGEEGLQTLATHPVQLVISDQNMPGMTGIEILKAPGPALLHLSKRTLTPAHIVSAVAELMPAYAATSFTGKQDEEIAYEAPAGRVVVRFSANGEGVRAELQPLAHAERAEQEKAASLSRAGVPSVKAAAPAA